MQPIDEVGMEEGLARIEPTQEDFINRRINHIPFAKVIFWLCYRSIKHEFVYATELADFLKVSQNWSYQILRDLSKVNLLKKRGQHGIIEFWFVKNTSEPFIMKYLLRAKKTLHMEENEVTTR
jgi:hypothetical protein